MPGDRYRPEIGLGRPGGLLPQGSTGSRTCPIKAAGPSCHAVATDGTPGWTAIASRSGMTLQQAIERSQESSGRRAVGAYNRRFQIHVAAVRNRFSGGELPVIP